MKESIKARVEKLEKTVGHTMICIVIDNLKDPGYATVEGKRVSMQELETFLKTLPPNVQVFTVETAGNQPFKGKVRENE
jgi:hypothetical protein